MILVLLYHINLGKYKKKVTAILKIQIDLSFKGLVRIF